MALSLTRYFKISSILTKKLRWHYIFNSNKIYVNFYFIIKKLYLMRMFIFVILYNTIILHKSVHERENNDNCKSKNYIPHYILS